MKKVLTDGQMQLLSILCTSGVERHLFLLKKFLDHTLASNEADQLLELISNEFLLNGIEESFEPNNYGLELELLLDDVKRAYVQGRNDIPT